MGSSRSSSGTNEAKGEAYCQRQCIFTVVVLQWWLLLSGQHAPAAAQQEHEYQHGFVAV